MGWCSGSFPCKRAGTPRPSCRNRCVHSAKESPLPSKAKAGALAKPGSLPPQLTLEDGSPKWACSLTPQVLRAYAGLNCRARRRHRKLMGELQPMIRNARSHEEQEMIQDRSVVAAVTFKGKASRQPALRRDKKSQGKPGCKGRWTCGRWASNLIAFGARDLPSSATRWKVREAYLQFVEDHNVPPGHEDLMTVTGLSARKVLEVLPWIEEDLGYSRSCELLQGGQASTAGGIDEVMALDLMLQVKKALAEVEAHDRVLWVLRFLEGYGPDSIVQLVQELRDMPSVEAIANTLEGVLGQWPELGKECRDSRLVETVCRLTSSKQVRCRLCRVNKRVKDRLRALGYRD